MIKLKRPQKRLNVFLGSGRKKFLQPLGAQLSNHKMPMNIFFNACFDKNQLKNLVTWFLDNYGEKLTIDFLETLKQVGFNQATLAGISLGVDDLQIPGQKSTLLSQAVAEIQLLNQDNMAGNVTSVEKSQRMIDTWNQTSEFLRQNAVQNFRNTNPVNPVFMMAFSGARGNISQVRQLVAMRGLMADPQGAILEFPIQSNFREGLTITEYLISCYGARKGLVDTALRTATSGYLTRRLVDAVQHIVVTIKDCGTTKSILLEQKNLESRLIGRVLAENVEIFEGEAIEKNQLISPSLAKRIAALGREISVRSALTCEAEKSVCQLCYGWNLAHGKLVNIGEAVGVIAAQSIGEPGTQLTMRTFHTGGVGVFSDQTTKSFIAPFDGKIELVEILAGLFVRTPHGKIVYMLKYTDFTPDQPVLRLKAQDSYQQVYLLTEQELPPGSILWVKQGEYVKSGQLLAQSSQIKASKRQMPESSYPVHSPLDGEIYFDSMLVLIREPIASKIKKSKSPEKTIVPTVRTLSKLGSFWVFSSSIQQQPHFAESLLRPGDLVSPLTPIFQYNFHVRQKSQLKYINPQKVLGQQFLTFPALKIRFFNFGYFISPTFHKKDIIFYNKVDLNFPTKNLLNYSFSIVEPKTYRYFFNLKNYFQISTSPSASTGAFTFDSSIFESNFLPRFCLRQELNFDKNSDPLKMCNSFELLFNSSKKTSIKNKRFQTHSNAIFHGNIREYFYANVLKNPKNISKLVEIGTKLKRSKTRVNYITGDFLIHSLKRAKNPIFSSARISPLKTRQGWIYISNPKAENFNLVTAALKSKRKVDDFVLWNYPVSVNYLSSKNIKFLNNQTQNVPVNSWYSHTEFLNFNKKKSKSNKFLHTFSQVDPDAKARKLQQQISIIYEPSLRTKKHLVFYRFKNQSKKFSKKKVQRIFFKVETKFKLKKLNLVEKLRLLHVSTQKYLNNRVLLNQKKINTLEIDSPLFIKQIAGEFYKKRNLLLKFQAQNSLLSKPLIRFDLTINSDANSFLTKSCTTFALWNANLKSNRNLSFCANQGFSLFLYNDLKIKSTTKFFFETFNHNWVLPKTKITKGFIKSVQLGEFRHLKTTQNESFVSILSFQDIKGLLLNKVNTENRIEQLEIGSVLRCGDQINSETVSPLSGQIIKITPYVLIVRIGVPILASARGILHVFESDFIRKNDLLVTLKSRRLQTEDIVQGIPKIEQLFEARETQGGEIIRKNVHTQLQTFFIDALKRNDLDLAVPESVKNIQAYLVANILEAYSSQGVKISEKHVEIIVRQMTSRVRILAGGDTGLLPGEIVQLQWIEKINAEMKLLGYHKAIYAPIVLGISKSVLQSESFLLAASFQEVSRVLVRSALSKKTDFLRGLHENVILGQLVPAGTGLVAENRQKNEKNYKMIE